MKKIISLILVCLTFIYFAFWHLPSSKEVTLNLPEDNEELLLVPLDSRPVCTTLPKNLGHLAGVHFILPPNEVLDKYTEPANKDFLQKWLKEKAPKTKSALVSTDLLLHGGLLHGRTHLASKAEQENLLELLGEVATKAEYTTFFSVVPRLLVSDEILPDAWYWYHLLRYSESKDTSQIFGDFKEAEVFHKYAEEIPAEIKNKYINIFQASQDFNSKLLDLSDKAQILIGQDDAQAFGLPRMTMERIGLHPKSKQAILTNGADELATLLFTRKFLAEKNSHPKVFVRLSDKKANFLHAPYMSMSIDQAVREALEIIGAKEVSHENEADIILFINYGHDNFTPNNKTVNVINNYLARGKQVALVDSSQNFETKELLLPKLLISQIDLNKLTAYAGWNTLGNSLGTALCQAAIFVTRKAELKDEDLPALYGENLRLNINRFLDDFFYQKLKHADLSYEVYNLGMDSRNLTEEEKRQIECELLVYTKLRAELLLHANLGRTPFYENVGKKYFLTDLTTTTQLPWNRIFEVDIKAYPKFGVRE